MKEQIEVYLHVEGTKSPELMRVSSEFTFGGLLASSGNINQPNEKEWFVMLEDSDEAQPLDRLLTEAGIKNRGHIYCGRCKKVNVFILFNGRNINDEFPLSATAKRILNWAVRELGISSEEATDHVLTLEDGTELNDRDHISMYVNFPNCKITLMLTREQAING